MYHATTNCTEHEQYPVCHFSGNASDVVKWIRSLPDGWQFSVTYAGCEIAYGMTGDDTPTPEKLILGACNVNGVD